MMDLCSVEVRSGRGGEKPVLNSICFGSMKYEKAETGRLIWDYEPLWLRQAPCEPET